MTKQVGTIYILKLKAPFYSAGHIYKWDFEDKVGFGIDSNILNNNDEIVIETKGQEYKLTQDDAFEFYKKHKIVENRGGLRIVIIPRAICKKLST